MTKTLKRYFAFVGVLSFIFGCIPSAQADSQACNECVGAARWRQIAYQRMQEEAKHEASAKQKEQRRAEENPQRYIKQKVREH